MAILHRKEEKIQVVLGRLPKKYSHDEFVEMFIKLYSKDWGKIKSAYVKQSQDKEPGTVVNMPKPDLYLKQLLETYLATKSTVAPVKEVKSETVTTKEPAKQKKTATNKKIEEPAKEVKVKLAAKKKVAEEKGSTARVKKSKTAEG